MHALVGTTRGGMFAECEFHNQGLTAHLRLLDGADRESLDELVEEYVVQHGDG